MITKKELNNMKIILKSSLELASEREFFSFNPINKVKLNYDLCRYVSKKLELLAQVNDINEKNHFPDEGFIYCGVEGRTTRREIAYCIEKACSKARIPIKSVPDIRITVASLMNKNDVAIDEIRRFLKEDSSSIIQEYSSVLKPKVKKNTQVLDL